MFWHLGAWQIMGPTAPTPSPNGSWFLEIVEELPTSMPLICTSKQPWVHSPHQPPELIALTRTLFLCLKSPTARYPTLRDHPLPTAYWNLCELTNPNLVRLPYPVSPTLSPCSRCLLTYPGTSPCEHGVAHALHSGTASKELLSQTAVFVSVIIPFLIKTNPIS